METDLNRTRTAPENRSRGFSRDALRRAKSTPEDEFHQYLSPQFMDDHGAHQYHAHAIRDDLDDDSTVSDDDTTRSNTRDSVEEVRFGVRDTRDIEANLAELKREKSARSIKDPTLVGSLLFMRAVGSNNFAGNLGWR